MGVANTGGSPIGGSISSKSADNECRNVEAWDYNTRVRPALGWVDCPPSDRALPPARIGGTHVPRDQMARWSTAPPANIIVSAVNELSPFRGMEEGTTNMPHRQYCKMATNRCAPHSQIETLEKSLVARSFRATEWSKRRGFTTLRKAGGRGTEKPHGPHIDEAVKGGLAAPLGRKSRRPSGDWSSARSEEVGARKT